MTRLPGAAVERPDAADPVRVLYYLREFPKLSESFVLNEIYELERRGHDVVVCARHEADADLVHDEFQAVDVPVFYAEPLRPRHALEALSPTILRPRVLHSARYRAPVAIHVANLVQTRRCVEFVDGLDWEPDHVHTHFARRSQYPAALLAAHYRTPLTVTVHAASLYKRPIHAATSTLLSDADRIVTISEYNRRHIHEAFAADTPIDVVRAGIRSEKFSPTAATVDDRILTVARFVEKKGLEYALEAVARVAEDVPDLEYHVVGSGPLAPALRRRTRELGLADTVEFLQTVDDDRLLREYDEARCFLLPCVLAASGDRDGIPVVLMEAMAMETPPVSTTVSGVPELVDHEENGLLTEPRDPDALATALRRLLQDDDTWSAYARRARGTVEAEFDVASEADGLVDAFAAARSESRSAEST